MSTRVHADDDTLLAPDSKKRSLAHVAPFMLIVAYTLSPEEDSRVAVESTNTKALRESDKYLGVPLGATLS